MNDAEIARASIVIRQSFVIDVQIFNHIVAQGCEDGVKVCCAFHRNDARVLNVMPARDGASRTKPNGAVCYARDGGYIAQRNALQYERYMNTRQIAFSVEGMFCARCAVDLERALAHRDGVIAACVNYASERATLLYDPTRVNPMALVHIVKDAGFSTPLEVELTMQANEAHLFGTHKRWLVPLLVGFGSGAALVVLYLAILSIAQSPSHALEQLSQDRLWVGLVALGFGFQIGLYMYLRLIVSAMLLAGATGMAGAGTTTSTVGMIACCAHHLADIAPLLGLAGVSALSPVVTFLAEWKIPFILFGLAVNAVAIVMSLRIIRRERAHLKMMESTVTPPTRQPAACH